MPREASSNAVFETKYLEGAVGHAWGLFRVEYSGYSHNLKPAKSLLILISAMLTRCKKKCLDLIVTHHSMQYNIRGCAPFDTISSKNCKIVLHGMHCFQGERHLQLYCMEHVAPKGSTIHKCTAYDTLLREAPFTVTLHGETLFQRETPSILVLHWAYCSYLRGTSSTIVLHWA
jgi:hypothetical protein